MPSYPSPGERPCLPGVGGCSFHRAQAPLSAKLPRGTEVLLHADTTGLTSQRWAGTTRHSHPGLPTGCWPEAAVAPLGPRPEESLERSPPRTRSRGRETPEPGPGPQAREERSEGRKAYFLPPGSGRWSVRATPTQPPNSGVTQMERVGEVARAARLGVQAPPFPDRRRGSGLRLPSGIRRPCPLRSPGEAAVAEDNLPTRPLLRQAEPRPGVSGSELGTARAWAGYSGNRGARAALHSLGLKRRSVGKRPGAARPPSSFPPRSPGAHGRPTGAVPGSEAPWALPPRGALDAGSDDKGQPWSSCRKRQGTGGVPTDGGAAHRRGCCPHALRTGLCQGGRPHFQAPRRPSSHGLPLPCPTPTSQHIHAGPPRVKKLPWTLPCFQKDYRGPDDGAAWMVTRAQLGTGTPRLRTPQWESQPGRDLRWRGVCPAWRPASSGTH